MSTIVCFVVLNVATCIVVSATHMSQPTASSNICGRNITIGRAVVNAMNLSYTPKLKAALDAAYQGDYNTACEEIATYYAQGNSSAWWRLPPVTPGNTTAGGWADELVFHDIFNLHGVNEVAKIPRNADGGFDWFDKGPRNDPEFMNCLNRHDSFTDLLNAWNKTGNPIYVRYFDALVSDWVLHLPCNHAGEELKPCAPFGCPGCHAESNCTWNLDDHQACNTGTMESPWRSLEAGIRTSGPWAPTFFGFQQAANFSVSSRVLMLLALAEHNGVLATDGGHPGHGTPNWEMTQWRGLLTTCIAFPELHNSSMLLKTALAQLLTLMDEGVYPDGIETEQASGYDMGTARDFFSVLVLASKASQQDVHIPQAFYQRVEAMFNYGTMVSDPQACLPRNGDSDRCGEGFYTDASDFFHRSDWVYVRTNGARGTPPASLSTMFPWGGQVC